MKKRVESLEEFRKMIDRLRAEISLKMTPLPKALKCIGESFSNRCFLICADRIKTAGGQAALENALEKTAKEYCFKKEDVSAILSLGQGLGRQDLKNQLRQIDYSLSMIDGCILSGKQEYCEKSRLYISGSALVGVCAVLMLL